MNIDDYTESVKLLEYAEARRRIGDANGAVMRLTEVVRKLVSVHQPAPAAKPQQPAPADETPPAPPPDLDDRARAVAEKMVVGSGDNIIVIRDGFVGFNVTENTNDFVRKGLRQVIASALARFGQDAAAEEREACAKTVENLDIYQNPSLAAKAGAAIRARNAEQTQAPIPQQAEPVEAPADFGAAMAEKMVGNTGHNISIVASDGNCGCGFYVDTRDTVITPTDTVAGLRLVFAASLNDAYAKGAAAERNRIRAIVGSVGQIRHSVRADIFKAISRTAEQRPSGGEGERAPGWASCRSC